MASRRKMSKRRASTNPTPRVCRRGTWWAKTSRNPPTAGSAGGPYRVSTAVNGRRRRQPAGRSHRRKGVSRARKNSFSQPDPRTCSSPRGRAPEWFNEARTHPRPACVVLWQASPYPAQKRAPASPQWRNECSLLPEASWATARKTTWSRNRDQRSVRDHVHRGCFVPRGCSGRKPNDPAVGPWDAE
jgi:hypothetical protein